MKIVDVAEFYSANGGGVRTYVQQKIAAGHRNGHEIVIVVPGAENRTEHFGGGRMRWVKSPHEFLDRRYHRFADPTAVHAILTEEAPDVVEASSPWNGARIVADWQGNAVRTLVMHNDPMAVYPHTFLDKFMTPARIDRIFLRFWRYLVSLRRQFDDCIVAGEWLANRFDSFGVGPCTVMPFGIEKAMFSPALRDPELRRRMLAACGIHDADAPLLIAVSRHHPEKRLGVLIDAIARLGATQPVGLFVVGDGPLRSWVERVASQVNGIAIAGQIPRETLARCLASADAMVHAGAAETFGLALAEGLCSGLPLVVPDRGGAADLASPAYAETYATGDATACADAIGRLLRRDREALTAATSDAGRALWTPDQHFAHLFAHYNDLCSERRPQTARAA